MIIIIDRSSFAGWWKSFTYPSKITTNPSRAYHSIFCLQTRVDYSTFFLDCKCHNRAKSPTYFSRNYLQALDFLLLIISTYFLKRGQRAFSRRWHFRGPVNTAVHTLFRWRNKKISYIAPRGFHTRNRLIKWNNVENIFSRKLRWYPRKWVAVFLVRLYRKHQIDNSYYVYVQYRFIVNIRPEAYIRV